MDRTERFYRIHQLLGDCGVVTRDVFVVSRASRVAALDAWGSLAFGAPDAPPDAFVALRVPGPTGQLSSGSGMTTQQP